MTQHVVKHAETGQVQIVGSLDGYGEPDWITVGEAPAGARPEYLEVIDGQVVENLALARARRWEAIKAVRAEKLLVAPTPLGTFDSDETGRSNINGQVTAILALGADAPAEITWKMHDNSFATFTAAQFVQAGLMVSEHIANVYATSWQLEQALNAAATLEEIEAVEWPAA